ncbi:MAG: hypothetical protein M1827_006555 [Pycnora praestabilis]|nr:MAG: hypothetical protein M1827_006555 [Pycnora praestabilis]
MRLLNQTSSVAPLLLTLSLFASSVVGQASSAIAALPQCWQNCINTASDGAIHCNAGDNACVCRSYNSDFLVNIVTCIKAGCTDQLSLSLLVEPLELYCNAAGVPIASSAIADAQNVATAAASTAATTCASATGAGSSSGSCSGSGSSSSSDGSSSSSSSSSSSESGSESGEDIITLTTTDSAGSTYLLIVPVTLGPSTTIYGETSTVTGPAATSSGRVTPVPIGPGLGSSQTTASTVGASSPSSLSSAVVEPTPTTSVAAPVLQTTTDAEGNTIIGTSTPAPPASSSTPPPMSGSTMTTTAKAMTTDTTKPSSTTSSSGNEATMGSPFSNKAASAQKGSSWLGLSIGLIAGIMWY